MSIGRICQRDVELGSLQESVVEAARRMRERGVGTLIVLDDARRPLGILTDRDLATRVVAEARTFASTRVGDVMSAHPRSVLETTPIEEALGTMRSLGIRRLLVCDPHGVLVGIVTLDDVLTHVMEEFQSMRDIIAKTSHSGVLASTRR